MLTSINILPRCYESRSLKLISGFHEVISTPNPRFWPEWRKVILHCRTLIFPRAHYNIHEKLETCLEPQHVTLLHWRLHACNWNHFLDIGIPLYFIIKLCSPYLAFYQADYSRHFAGWSFLVFIWGNLWFIGYYKAHWRWNMQIT